MSKPSQPRWSTLDDLRERLETADLIPSQEPLRDRLAGRFDLLTGIGIASIADLRSRLKDRRSVEKLAHDSTVEVDYLMLLRRAVNSFHPKPRPLRTFAWLDHDVLTALEAVGVKNSGQLGRATENGPVELAEQAGVPTAELATLSSVAGLLRVQWVSPNFGRALVAAGFPSARAVAQADPDVLSRAVAAANEEGGFYNGTVGLRDIARVVDAARYVPWITQGNDAA